MRDGLYQAERDWQLVLRFFGVLLLIGCSGVSTAADVVRAELGKDAAWTGEGVPLMITLYSPGPFSGTASFDIPQLPKTTFVHAGSPLVGSERIDDKSFFTQRHEFTIYTQRAGEIVIPAFLVRFASKKSFTSQAEPREGMTQELHFESRRPPGSEDLKLVLAARKMEPSQTWQPNVSGPVQAGDVIARTITRRAVDTTAMMFPPIMTETLSGVRCYLTDPIVQDSTERGASRAERSETIKYQFERAGAFQLPDVTVTWWDPDADELKREVLPGATINVVDSVAAGTVGDRTSSGLSPAIFLALFLAIAVVAVVASLGRRPGLRFIASWQARRNRADSVAARRLLAACRADDAFAAYAALNEWQRVVSASDAATQLDDLMQSAVGNPLQQEWNILSQRLFGNKASEPTWSGRALAAAFARARQGLKRTVRTRRAISALVALNPTAPAA